MNSGELFGGRPDSSNLFAVGAKLDGTIVVMRPVMGAMTKAEAINLAAWLKLLADPTGVEFDRLVEEIKRH